MKGITWMFWGYFVHPGGLDFKGIENRLQLSETRYLCIACKAVGDHSTMAMIK